MTYDQWLEDVRFDEAAWEDGITEEEAAALRWAYLVRDYGHDETALEASEAKLDAAFGQPPEPTHYKGQG